ncbi:nucleobindin-2 [Drosophila miranda]|uniref:nucleobindin-2 n=1 Tax=Drosophila miranda TaxID=7229 RepID=UPI0007E7F981|nr:nucleobindin-2 [Drosophila miranda]XP_033242449.1 nucleobindin-2 [Drosophila miranda]
MKCKQAHNLSLLGLALVVSIAISAVTALPVTQNKKTDPKEAESSSTPATADVETALEYERYLREVVEALEADPEFRQKLDKAPEADIRSGKIAQELDYVNHHVRTKLDEIKRRELERLRELANQAYELSNDIDRKHLKVPLHLDHDNEHTFEIEDLKKLIQKTSDDLAEADRKRRGDFKEYEMQKEFEREAQKKEMDEASRKKFEEELKQKEEKHKDHGKLHHPGNKAQLEEVWEKQDHMDKNDFEPKTFFSIHDVDSNGYWDEAEVKALFVKELDKVYQSDLPEDDMRERAEEMERMREHYFQETDTNHDGLISIEEFMMQTSKDEFQKDPEWETIDQQPQYTHEEYLEYERRRQEEVQRMIAQGQLPPHPNMPQGYYSAPPPGGVAYHPPNGQLHYQQQDQQHAQQQQQYAQQQQQYAQQYQQQQYGNGQPVQLHPNQVYQHAGQIPQQQPVYQQPQPVQYQQQQQPVQQQQQPVQQQQQPVQQQQQPVQQQQQPVQQQQQPVQQQQQPVQYQQQQPVQQQQQPVQQQQQQPIYQQQQSGNQQSAPQQQQQQQQQPVQQQQPQAQQLNNQSPPPVQNQQLPVQQQQKEHKQNQPIPQQQH